MKRMYLVAAARAATQLGNTDCGQIIEDPGFDLWCGQGLCAWKIERGDARRVPTWHTGDDGVELVGADVSIAQRTGVTSQDSTCIEFSMLTDVDESAEVHLQFDVFGDGVADYDQLIPAAHWQPVSYLVRIQPPWNGLTFRLIKQGEGHAVLGEIKAQTSDACTGTSVAPRTRPFGAYCVAGTDCDSGVCVGGSLFEPGTCGSCDRAAQCPTGTVCGVDDAVSWSERPHATCVPPGQRELGELCWFDEECATGLCSGYACSTCDPDRRACDGGETCTRLDDTLTRPDGTTGLWPAPPAECDAGLGHRATGETCLRDGDCASARCDGPALTVCDGDGRTCASSLDCPEDSGFTHGACVAVGIAGGRCR